MEKQYAIKNKQTGEFFGGFEPAPSYAPIWVAKQDASTWAIRDYAEAQAIALHRMNYAAQQKPVSI